MSHDRFHRIMKLNRRSFKRCTGIYPETFWEMEAALQDWHASKTKSGRPPALTLAEQLLLTLEFWREYRTLFHLAGDWGIHESTAFRTIERVENALIQSGKFSLPRQKDLAGEDIVWSAVLVDVTEVPCERPKKTKGLV